MKRWFILFLCTFLWFSFADNLQAQQATLRVLDGSGSPGSTGNPVFVELSNSTQVRVVQFALNFDGSVLQIADIQPTGRTEDMGTFSWILLDSGTVVILIQDLTGQIIETGVGPIATVFFDVTEGLLGGEVSLGLSDAVLFDPASNPLSVQMQGGTFRVTVPDVSLSMQSYNYGYVLVGSSKEWVVTVYNEGTGNLSISNMTSDNFEFAVTSPTFPQSVAPGESLNVTIVFSPSLDGPRSASVFVYSNDPDEPQLGLSLTGGGTSVDIELSATEHDYGTVRVGSVSEWILTIYNLGVGDLTVFDMTSDHSDFSISQPVFPQVVSSAGSLDVSIRFLPSSRGMIATTLILTCDDPDEASIPLLVSGTGIAPDIQFSTTSHDFGEIEIGTTEGWLFTIYNTGTADLTVNTITSNNPEFSVTLPTFPQTILTGNHLDVVFSFGPSFVGERNAVISVESDDPFNPTSILTLSGDGVPSAELQVGQGSGSPGTVNNAVPILMTNRKSVTSLRFILNYNASDIQVSNITPTARTAQMGIFSWSEPIAGRIVLLVQDLTDRIIGPGSGTIVHVYFDVDVDATPSEEPITLSDISLSDPDGDTIFTIFEEPGSFTISAPEIAVSSPSHTFGSVVLGNSATWTLKIYNEGTTDLLVTGITTTHSDFSIFIPDLPQTIVVEESLAVAVQFSPSSLGNVTGAVTIVSDDPDEGLVSVPVSGTGVVSNIELSAYSHHFGEVVIGTSSPWSLTIYNTGTANLIVTHTSIDHDDFHVHSPAFPQTVTPTDSIVVELSFDPSALGTVTGTLTLFSNDPEEEELSLVLMGVGIAPDIDVITSSHDFEEVIVGGTSNWVMRIFNVGTADLIVSDITSSGADYNVIAPTFPQTILPNDFLDVMVSFSPSIEGFIIGQLMVLSNDNDESSFAISVEGQGIAADIHLPVGSYNFGQVLLQTSNSWTFDILNLGVVLLEVNDVTTGTSDFVVDAPSFPQNIMPGDTLTVIVLFRPSVLGVLRDTLEIRSSDPDESTLMLPLQGSGVAPHIDLSAETKDFGGIVVGRSSNWTLTIQNTGTHDLHITNLSMLDSTEFNIDKVTLPYTLAPSNNLAIAVIFRPTTSGPKTDTLTIVSSDFEHPVTTVSFSGQGIPPPELSVFDQSGQPGTADIMVPINLINDMAVSKMAFTLHYDTDRFVVTEMSTTVRDNHMDSFSWSESTPGQIGVTIDDTGADIIHSGRGWIVEVHVDVKADAPVGDTLMTLTNVSLWDDEGVILPRDISDGIFHIVQVLHKVTFAVPHRSRPAGDTFTVPIKLLDDITGLNVFSIQFEIVFDPQILTAVDIDDHGTLADLWRNYPDSRYQFAQGIQEDRIVAVFAVAVPLFGDGTFMNITFEVASEAQPGDVSPLHFENFRVNEGQPPSDFIDGWFSVASVPDIDFSFREHDYDSTTIGSSKDWQLTIFNVGTEDLVVDSVVSTEPDYTLGDVSLPYTVASNDHFDVIVSFQPSRLGEIIGSLRIVSNDADEPTSHVVLKGVGISEVGVELADFSGTWTGSDVVLQWSMSSAFGIVGFHVYRKDENKGEYLRLTARPIMNNEDIYFRDNLLPGSGIYTYRLNVVNSDGSEEHIGMITVKVEDITVSSYFLAQNYPNPFNPETQIYYGLAEEDWVTLDIYNTLGQKVRTLVNEVQYTGTHVVSWDGVNESGAMVPSGVYYYRLKLNKFTETKSMLLLR